MKIGKLGKKTAITAMRNQTSLQRVIQGTVTNQRERIYTPILVLRKVRKTLNTVCHLRLKNKAIQRAILSTRVVSKSLLLIAKRRVKNEAAIQRITEAHAKIIENPTAIRAILVTLTAIRTRTQETKMLKMISNAEVTQKAITAHLKTIEIPIEPKITKMLIQRPIVGPASSVPPKIITAPLNLMKISTNMMQRLRMIMRIPADPKANVVKPISATTKNRLRIHTPFCEFPLIVAVRKSSRLQRGDGSRFTPIR